MDSGDGEIGVDESGRGPAFGRVYAAAVIWPRGLETPLIRDSKTIKSDKRMKEAYDYVIKHAVAYSIAYATESEIDELNILQADMLAMHRAIDAVQDMRSVAAKVLVDGNYFRRDGDYPFETVVKGDSKYYSIAAASILAKWSRDQYISDMCRDYPVLQLQYDLLSNKGYPSPTHLEGIRLFGISPFHRKTFRCCQDQPEMPMDFFVC
jgi:ribonuclease HII